MITNKNAKIIFIFALLFSMIFLILNYKHSIMIVNLNKIPFKIKTQNVQNSEMIFKQNEQISRDFFRYKCNNRKRIGGFSNYLNGVPHNLYRVEGNIILIIN
jgi:hypothetical protein